MSKIKDYLYDYFVKKNGRVWYEYERYVREHMEEYHLHRFSRIRVLIKLNWFYRVKKGNTPYLYWDVPLDPNAAKSRVDNQDTVKMKVDNQCTEKENTEKSSTTNTVKKKITGNPFKYPEISAEKRISTNELIEKLSAFDVVSFDVFDTLVLRYVSDPKDVFLFVGNKLQIYDYKTVRIRAEEDARNNSDNVSGEVKFDKICELVARYLGIEKTLVYNTEFQTELEVCYANPYMKEVVNGLVRLGKRVIATSNMYLSSRQIDELLKCCGYNNITEIFVSCEFGVTKYKGELQKKVWESIGNEKEVIHVGDNYIVDYIGSRMAGWKAYYYKNVNEIGNKYRPAKMTRMISSIYGGIVNGHFHNGINSGKSIFYELGFGYLGILIIGYCKWINKYAKSHGIDKILFTSRDMNLVYEIYNKYFNEIDSEYIRVSRFAAQRFSYERFSDYFIDSHIKARAFIAKLTIKEVLEELNISFMKPYLEEYGFSLDDIFSMKNFLEFRKCLNNNKEIMLKSFEKEKEDSKKYYSQFVKPNQHIAIVDLGWQGSNALCLKYLYEEEMDYNLTVNSLMLVSYGNREFVTNTFSAGVADSYCFSANKNEQLCNQFSPSKMGRFICELLFSSNEKSLKTISINDEGNFVFSYIENEKRNEKQIEEIYQGARSFVEIWQTANLFDGVISGWDAILPLNKFTYSDICFEIMEGNEINPWIGETKNGSASNIRKIVR